MSAIYPWNLFYFYFMVWAPHSNTESQCHSYHNNCDSTCVQVMWAEEEEYITSHSKSCSEQHASSKRDPTLVSYPIIFYFLTFIPLTDQIYQSTMEQANYYLIMTHVISTGLWGFFFSSTQLVHVLVNKKFRRKKRRNPVVNKDQTTTRLIGNDQIVSYTEISTFAKTTCPIPRESDTDDHEQGK